MKTFPRPLTTEEEKDYLERYRNGDLKAKDVLIERNLRLVAMWCGNTRQRRMRWMTSFPSVRSALSKRCLLLTETVIPSWGLTLPNV